MEQMEQLLEILEEVRPGVDFTEEQHLVDDGILDSLSIVTLVAELCDAFDVEITVTDILPENFQSAGAMLDMIVRLQAEA